MGVMRAAARALAVAFVLSACGGAAGPSAPSPTNPSVAQTGSGALKIVDNPKLGKILVAANGMTLYTFDQDSPNKSACTGTCIATWPPLTIASGDAQAPAGLTGTLGVATRADGGRQVTHNGSPLYFYVGDTKAGDTSGDGIDSDGGKWYAVRNP
jgi:predicted lipoprotein with Yx(FWY)xxD motif